MSEPERKPLAWWVCDAENIDQGSAWRFKPSDDELEFMATTTGQTPRVIELGDVAAERSRIASLLRARGQEELARVVEGGDA